MYVYNIYVQLLSHHNNRFWFPSKLSSTEVLCYLGSFQLKLNYVTMIKILISEFQFAFSYFDVSN